MELDNVEESQFREILYDQRKECNIEFGKFIEKNYSNWAWQKTDSPALSTDLIKNNVIPEIKKGKKIIYVYLIIPLEYLNLLQLLPQ